MKTFWAALDTRDYQRVSAENSEEAAEKLVEKLGYEYWNHEQEVSVLTEEPDDEKQQTPEVFIVEIGAVPVFTATRKLAPENKTGSALNRPGDAGSNSAMQGDYTACSKCGHPMENHDDVIGCFEYECECDVRKPAPAGGEARP